MEHHFGGTCSCYGVKKDTQNMKTHVSCKRIGNVMVSVVVHGAIDRGFVCHLGQIKDYEIHVCCFSAKHTVLYLNHLLLSFYTLSCVEAINC